MEVIFLIPFIFASLLSNAVTHVGEVGESCNWDSRYVPCNTPNTYCNNDICTCKPLYEQVNGECILKSSRTLASKCRTSAECTGKGEYCNRSNGKCQCLSTHFVLDGKCKPVIYPGQKGCEDSRQCAKAYPSAYCTNQNKCQCPKGFKVEAFSCFKRQSNRPVSEPYTLQQKRSQPFQTNYDYNGFHEKAKSVPSFIPTVIGSSVSSHCLAHQVFIKEIGICMTTRLPGEHCQYSEQCAAIESEAFCQRLKCECAPGMKVTENSCTFMNPKCTMHGHIWIPELSQCMQVLSPGADGCIHSAQCSAGANGAYCFRHKCKCPGKLIPTDKTCGEQCQTNMTFSAIVGSCIPVIKPGRECQYSTQCEASITEMVCIRGICRCPFGKVLAGERCAESCLPGHATSSNGICRQVPIGSACPAGTEQCLGGSTCLYDICKCPFGTVAESGVCILEQKVPVGYPCNSTHTCIGIANCVNGICRCPMGMYVQDGHCREFMSVDTETNCANRKFCNTESTCTESICSCPIGTTNQNGLCIAESKSKCSNSLQCKGNSYCDQKSGLCICKDGHQDTDQSCLPKFFLTLISPIESCITNSDCRAGSKCIANRCHCPAGEIFIGDRCQIVFAEPGESCLNGETCISNYVCINGSCLCPDGEVSKDGNCVTDDTEIKSYRNYQAKPNFPCRRGEVCIGGSFCDITDGICRCPANSIYQNERCEFTNEQIIFPPKKFINQSKDILKKTSNHHHITDVTRVTLNTNTNRCKSNDDCKAGSYCSGHRCVCPSNMLMKNGLCQRIHPISRRKDAGVEVDPDDTNFESMFTALPVDSGIEHIPSSRQTEVIVNISGGVCNETTLCLFFSICRNGVCKCPLGSRISDTECKFMVDLTRLRQFEKLLRGDHSLLTHSKRSTLSVRSQRTDRLLPITTTATVQPIVGVNIKPENQIWGTKKVWRTTRSQMIPSMTSTSRSNIYCGDGKTYCTGGSICVNNHCVCKSDDLMIDGICIPQANVRCKTAQECPSRAQCIDGLCSCISGTAMSRYGLCIPVITESSPGLSCTNGEKCIGFSKCIRGICTCPPERNTIVNNECVESIHEGRSIHCIPGPTIRHDDKYFSKDFRILKRLPYTSHTSIRICVNNRTLPQCTEIKNYRLEEFFGINCTECTTNSMYSGNHCKYISNQVNQLSLMANAYVHLGDFHVNVSLFNLLIPKLPFQRLFLLVVSVPSPKIHKFWEMFCNAGLRESKYLRKMAVITPEFTSSWQPLKECHDADSCLLPNCFCSRFGLEIPGNLMTKDVPQIILLTFEGPITDRTFAIYESLFSGNYRNPNGCPIKGTFFVSNERNNYDQTQWLISNGHEIAVNSITRQDLSKETLERWKNEMVGMRDALRHFSFASASSITGVRAPQLKLGGDNQFDMMEKFDFLYDNSMSASGGPYWPQTLAYSTAWKCSSRNCPKYAHSNIWEIPINRFTVLGSRNEFTMLKEAIHHDDSASDVAEMLEMNFNRSYNYNRAPFLLTVDNDFFNVLPNDGAIIGLKFFIEKILKNSDVYFVTVTQALKWIRRPTRLLHIHNFESWQCNVPFKNNISICEMPSTCSFTCNGETQILRICGTCPQVYPNLGDPTGTGNSTIHRRFNSKFSSYSNY